MTEIYLHIFARMADYMATHPYQLRDVVSDPVIVCSTSDGWNNVHKTCVDALDFLGKHRFIEWSQGLERYSPTPFGLATFCSSLPPKDAITVAR